MVQAYLIFFELEFRSYSANWRWCIWLDSRLQLSEQEFDNSCPVQKSETQIGFDTIAFLFIVMQIRILHSYYFQHCMLDFRAEAVLINRFAFILFYYLFFAKILSLVMFHRWIVVAWLIKTKGSNLFNFDEKISYVYLRIRYNEQTCIGCRFSPFLIYSRGAILTNQLIKKEMKEQNEQQSRKFLEIRDRTEKIRKRYEEQQRLGGAGAFVPEGYAQGLFSLQFLLKILIFTHLA